jgi:hypothetical protein
MNPADGFVLKGTMSSENFERYRETEQREPQVAGIWEITLSSKGLK